MKILFIILSFVFSFNLCFAQQFDSSYTGLTTIAPTSIIKMNDVLYLGTRGHRIYYSTNNGQAWNPIYYWSGLYPTWIKCLCGHNGNILAGTNNGLFRSTNLGYSWIKMDSLSSVKNISSIISIGNIVLASSAEGFGVYRSYNGGLNWFFANNGLDQYIVQKMKIRNGRIYIATTNNLYYSNDTGSTWNKIHSFDSITYSIEDFEVNNNVLYASIRNSGGYRSTNNGQNWARMLNVGNPSTNLGAMLTHNGITYINNNNMGIYKTTDNGETFLYCSYKLGGRDIGMLEEIENEIYAGLGGDYSGAGIYKTTNQGEEWSSLNNKYLQPPWGLSYTWAATGNLYISFIGNSFALSTNNGNSWYMTIVPGHEYYYYHVDLLTDSGRVYAMIGNTIMVSSDNGYIWEKRNFEPPPETAFTKFCKSGNNIYIGTYQGKLYKSTDCGASISEVTTTGLPQGDRFECIGIKDNYLFAGFFENGIYRSSDGGSSWDSLKNGLPANFNYVPLLQITTEAVYIARSCGYDIYKSTNYGDSWNVFYQGPTTVCLRNFVVKEPYAFASYDWKRVYTTNRGLTWSDVMTFYNSGASINFSISNNYAIATGASIMRAKMYEGVGINSIAENVHEFSLSQNYPNPFNSETAIKYTISKKGIVTITLNDVLGRELYVLKDYKSEGEYTHRFSFQELNLHSGLYFYSVRSENNVITKKMIYLK